MSETDLPVPKYEPSAMNIDEAIAELDWSLKELVKDIKNGVDHIERFDLKMNILTYKMFEGQHDFRKEVDEIMLQRQTLILNDEMDKSTLAVKLTDVDQALLRLQNQHETHTFNLNRQKLENQEQMEKTIGILDTYFDEMKHLFEKFQELLTTKAQSSLDVDPHIDSDYEEYSIKIQEFGKLQFSGWKVMNSEIRLAEVLDERGLKVTQSGLLLTKTGSRLGYEEAELRGLLKDLQVPPDRLFPFMPQKESTVVKMTPPPFSAVNLIESKNSSVLSELSCEDVEYLKNTVGRPLTMALAEITAKQPRDPIHYLGHYLFKYRYNREIEEVQKQEVDALIAERKHLAKERWDRLIYEEARNAVIEMVMRAEEEAYRNELKRIEKDMAAMAAEEEEAYWDEARDKFD